jgi:hypothetical protein
VTLSTESDSPSQPPADADARCAGCGAPLAADQRYCLECGERSLPPSSVLRGGPPAGDTAPASASPPGASPPAPSPADRAAERSSTLTVIAGVGVLLLAMGVGVLIGRSGASKQSAPPAQVISIAGAPSAAASAPTPAASEATFSSSWPSGTSGYTVQLQTLAQSGTAVSAVESAEAAARAKGAKAVGALKSEEFASLTAGSYVIYSGVHHTKSEAEKALAGLKKSFPAAKVIKVSNGASSSSAQPPTSSPGGVGQSESHPAPPSVLKSLKSVKGKSYEERSKNLPDVVED